MAKTVAKAPSSEAGYVNGRGPDNWYYWDPDERVPDLQWPESAHVYRRMDSEDGRVSSVLQAITLPIRRTPWRVEPNGARDEVVTFVADNLGLPVSGTDTPETKDRLKGRFSWGEHLQGSLQMLRFGHAFFEQVYRIGDDGRAYLRKLAPRPQTTICKIHVALDGGLVSIVQTPPASSGRVLYGLQEVEIPVSRLVAYVRDPDPGVWVGRSLLRPAYKHWLLKDELMRIQAATARRNGMGVPVYTAPEGASDKDVQAGQEIASRYRGGENSGVGLPHDAKLQLLGVQGNLPDIGAAIDYHDKQIALAGLAHFLNLDRGGSYALASVQADTFVQSVQTFAETIRDTANAHIVEDLVDINFGESEPAPRIVFDEIGSRQDATAAALKMLVDAGLLTPDESVRAVIRQALGLPPGAALPATEPAAVKAARVKANARPAQGELF